MNEVAPNVEHYATWIALLSALLTGPIGYAVARWINARAETQAQSVADNNRGQNQMLEGLRADMDQVLGKAGLESVAPKPPPAPRAKRTTGRVRLATPLPFFPPNTTKPGG